MNKISGMLAAADLFIGTQGLGITRCEMTALEHTAVYRFTFGHPAKDLRLLVDLDWGIGAPQVPLAQVKVGGEGEQRTFKVLARGLSMENKYVKSVMLNGRPLADRQLRQTDLVAGGTLVFEMTNEPVRRASPQLVE